MAATKTVAPATTTVASDIVNKLAGLDLSMLTVKVVTNGRGKMAYANATARAGMLVLRDVDAAIEFCRLNVRNKAGDVVRYLLAQCAAQSVDRMSWADIHDHFMADDAKLWRSGNKQNANRGEVCKHLPKAMVEVYMSDERVKGYAALCSAVQTIG